MRGIQNQELVIKVRGKSFLYAYVSKSLVIITDDMKDLQHNNVGEYVRVCLSDDIEIGRKSGLHSLGSIINLAWVIVEVCPETGEEIEVGGEVSLYRAVLMIALEAAEEMVATASTSNTFLLDIHFDNPYRFTYTLTKRPY